MENTNLPKTYNPKDFESRLYSKWIEDGLFKSKPNPNKKPFTIMLPPPNITGQLHMGHALDHTLQDILIRWKRMDGYEALWQPGTDHASIATEVKVVERIKEQEGKSKYDLGREEFLKRAMDWRNEFGRKIVDQMKQLGDSCDWDRERFTMDEGCNEAVIEFFIKLYEKGQIYRGNRIINWCPDCKTTLSDAEVEHEEHDGKFYHIKYPIVGSDEFLEIATTRPETMLGDSGIAVNPEDERYTHLVGKKAILPLVNREIIIVADDYVDLEFGTGAVKMTPAHDPNDFEVGQRHNLEKINVMNEDGTMNKLAGKYEGMDRYECRKQLIADLDEAGYLIAIKDHNHNVGSCYRCHTVVEPRLSDQWFVKMDELAKPAIDILKKQELKFVPDKFDKTYLQWLENIRDWCISRQLWWGHQIPAYYCQECGEVVVAKEMPTTCPKCGHHEFKQDEDVLDTWFSSALWPFSTLGWPHNTEELNYYYPTSVLVTGYDIIFFWVVRMAFAGMFCMGETPFEHVLIHGLVRDSEGRKMSKSLGNGIDPLEVIDQYGADALRFMLATGNSPGNDMRFYMERVEASRNFANKLWNASRFVFMNIDEEIMNGVTRESVESSMTLADKWIISRANNVVKEVNDNMDKFDLGIAAQKIYDFAWSEYCDWYIEIVKPRLYSDDKAAKQTALYTLTYVLEKILKLLHPYMPFITEEIYTHLPTVEGSIVVAQWPHYTEEDNMAKEEEMMNLTMDGIRNIRNVRAEMNVPPSKKAKVIIVPTAEKKEAMEAGRDYFVTLASASVVEIVDNEAGIPEDAVSVVIDGVKIFIPLDELVDFTKELDRLNKEKAKLEGEIKRVNGKLSNQGFLAKAPESLVNEEKAKKEKFEEMMKSVLERIENIEAKIK
ncbi:valine--tRNA ligase [Romboutsia sp. 1001216sp1]|uniref:valine--tRNA ligase n=1 Tax=unclassified Romboutsia TaxID=2626894 RepID=UPI002330D8C8|nr:MULTISPECIES: valine--tRNA ligase [unclassified Romboutsia]MDB8789238.1 valine--tRNA ligase [Romboutsia sp. 1001216sp1]MDB8793240.1 valine--tRNA ligase [Romboutsia sp. 1001216sp1]MDB8796032.1 valine--tRNA ligase [Romboutsia sp. 1001216sp1]MDB8799528.1 valine--tRNA ligase [Romboutsia sp. 1001216sp1]MDB8802186.1 valine--tRNA ligase [Romboutsia sp. 1001216sp1]